MRPQTLSVARVGSVPTLSRASPEGWFGRQTEGKCRPASPAQARFSAKLTCCRPRAWAVALAAAAASLVAVALARRLRPPPPRSLSLPPPPGLMRDPRFLLRRLRPGKGAPGPQKTPRSSPAAAPPLPVPTGELRGPPSRGLGCELLRARPQGGAEGGAAARGRNRWVRRDEAQVGGGSGRRAPRPADG